MEELLQKIQAAFPGLKWQKVGYNTDGWDHKVVFLDDKIVFRFPDEIYESKLKNEIAVLNVLRPQLNIEVPNYQYIPSDITFAGYPMLQGKTLTKDLFDTLSAEDITAIAKQLAGCLSVLHTWKISESVAPNIPPFYMTEDQGETKQAVEKHLRVKLSKDELAVIDTILKAVDDVMTNQPPHVFLHGDVYSRHLLWNDTTKKLGLIDFSDMSTGDPAIDFAELHEYGKDFVEEVYKYYQGPKDDTFLERTWIYQCWVGVYMMADHFRYSKTSFAEARETFDRIRVTGRYPATS